MSSNIITINGSFANEIEFEDRKYLYFGGTAYLGLTTHQGFINLHLKGINKFGLNNGISRNNNVGQGIYDDAEVVAAQRFGSEKALILSSGYLAAQLAVQHLVSFGQVIYAPSAHPALWVNREPASAATSFCDWKTNTIELINRSAKQTWVLISNSMNNLFPEIFDFDFINLINPEKQLILIIDDSHGIGVINDGMGIISALQMRPNIEIIVVASMAKALGIDAGVILGSTVVIDRLKSSPIFAGASPPSPAAMYAFIHAEKIYAEQLEKLLLNIFYLSKHLSADWKSVSGFPAFFTDRPAIDQLLMKEHILISSFPYPNKDSEPVNRVVLSSWHSRENIDYLLAALGKIQLS